MFSPDTTSIPPTRSLRPKRARQTPSDDSIKLPRAKKQRSALRRDTFEPLAGASLNEVAGRSDERSAVNGQAKEVEALQNGNLEHAKQLTLRGGKKSEKRSERANGALLLVLYASSAL